MADVKKDVKKVDAGGGEGFSFEDVVLLIFGIITIFFVIVPRFSSESNSSPASPGSEMRSFYNKLFNEQQIDANTKEPSLIDQTRFRVTDIVKNIFYIIIICAIFFSILFWVLKNYFNFKLKIIKEE